MKYSFISIISIIIFIFILNPHKIYSSNSAPTPSTPQPNRKECYLTKRTSMDPFPSLSKCYKYNNEACCTSVHDEYISGYISEILPDACLRKYNDFENLMCFGCHPLSSNYLSLEEGENGRKKMKIRLCKSFIKSLWNATTDEELYEPTTIFDNCGFKVNNLKEIANEANYIIPSEAFNNYNEFFKYIKIPLFEDAEIEMQDETNENCYNKGGKYKGKFIAKFIILVEIIGILLF